MVFSKVFSFVERNIKSFGVIALTLLFFFVLSLPSVYSESCYTESDFNAQHSISDQTRLYSQPIATIDETSYLGGSIAPFNPEKILNQFTLNVSQESGQLQLRVNNLPPIWENSTRICEIEKKWYKIGFHVPYDSSQHQYLLTLNMYLLVVDTGSTIEKKAIGDYCKNNIDCKSEICARGLNENFDPNAFVTSASDLEQAKVCRESRSPPNSPCSENNDCASDSCTNNICDAKKEPGAECTLNEQCASDKCIYISKGDLKRRCATTRWSVSVGCREDNDCISNNCVDTFCANPVAQPIVKRKHLEICTTNEECTPYVCIYMYPSDEQKKCLDERKINGHYCKENNDCSSNNCLDRVCHASGVTEKLLASFEACNSDAECASNICIYEGSFNTTGAKNCQLYRIFDGEKCRENTDCKSNNCVNSVCVAADGAPAVPQSIRSCAAVEKFSGEDYENQMCAVNYQGKIIAIYKRTNDGSSLNNEAGQQLFFFNSSKGLHAYYHQSSNQWDNIYNLANYKVSFSRSDDGIDTLTFSVISEEPAPTNPDIKSEITADNYCSYLDQALCNPNILVNTVVKETDDYLVVEHLRLPLDKCSEFSTMNTKCEASSVWQWAWGFVGDREEKCTLGTIIEGKTESFDLFFKVGDIKVISIIDKTDKGISTYYLRKTKDKGGLERCTYVAESDQSTTNQNTKLGLGRSCTSDIECESNICIYPAVTSLGKNCLANKFSVGSECKEHNDCTSNKCIDNVCAEAQASPPTSTGKTQGVTCEADNECAEGLFCINYLGAEDNAWHKACWSKLGTRYNCQVNSDCESNICALSAGVKTCLASGNESVVPEQKATKQTGLCESDEECASGYCDYFFSKSKQCVNKFDYTIVKQGESDGKVGDIIEMVSIKMPNDFTHEFPYVECNSKAYISLTEPYTPPRPGKYLCNVESTWAWLTSWGKKTGTRIYYPIRGSDIFEFETGTTQVYFWRTIGTKDLRSPQFILKSDSEGIRFSAYGGVPGYEQ